MDYSSLKYYLLLGCIVVVLLYVSIKTQSLHIVKIRLWQWIFGHDRITDPTVKTFVEQQSNLMAFRLFSHLQVSSLQELHQLETWATHRGINLSELSRIHHFFDIPGRCIKRVASSAWYLRMNFIAAVLATAFGLIFLMISTEHRANIRVNATDNWYWIDERAAYASQYNWAIVFAGTETLTSEQCTAEPFKAQEGLTPVDRDVLCSTWQNKAAASQIQSLIVGQRLLALYFLTIFCVFAIGRIDRIKQLHVVKKIQPRMTMDHS
ncbi:DUF6216 family protein [Limnohabitans sp. DM1]|uniref:DUF6216 family protein n=1 Tax=Limnohabitans sp. DM1 TaxID=1597955 RepID=UPI000AFCC008|nr:DUF6216 family protein [Limnohabitans sp. DM1]